MGETLERGGIIFQLEGRYMSKGVDVSIRKSWIVGEAEDQTVR